MSPTTTLDGVWNFLPFLRYGFAADLSPEGNRDVCTDLSGGVLPLSRGRITSQLPRPHSKFTIINKEFAPVFSAIDVGRGSLAVGRRDTESQLSAGYDSIQPVRGSGIEWASSLIMNDHFGRPSSVPS